MKGKRSRRPVIVISTSDMFCDGRSMVELVGHERRSASYPGTRKRKHKVRERLQYEIRGVYFLCTN